MLQSFQDHSVSEEFWAPFFKYMPSSAYGLHVHCDIFYGTLLPADRQAVSITSVTASCS